MEFQKKGTVDNLLLFISEKENIKNIDIYRVKIIQCFVGITETINKFLVYFCK